MLGIVPLFFSRPAADRSSDIDIKKAAPVGITDGSNHQYSTSDIKKETSGEAGDGPRHSCNCLGRDTIANAAARVGPSVVNLSVPQGML